MAQHSYLHRCIALSGLVQAIQLVIDIAKQGAADETAFKTSIESIFVLNPTSVIDVYQGIKNIKLGIYLLDDLLNQKKTAAHMEILRYVTGTLYLEGKLNHHSAMLNTLGTRLLQIQRQVDHFSSTHDTVITNLAELYQDTLSTFKFRVQIVGKSGYLHVPENANKIRALLLAAIRAATLWRQVGGRRWQLLLALPALRKATHALKQEVSVL